MSLLITSLLLALALLGLLSKRRNAPAQYGGAVPASTPPATVNHIKVTAYNIHRARGTDGLKDLKRITRVLDNSDIAGLSELEGGIPYIKPNQLKQLASSLQLSHLFACTQQRWGRDDRGNGLLSRFSIDQWYVEPLPDSVGGHPRNLLRADMQIGAKQIAVFVTHLARRTDQAVQLETVMRRFRQHEHAILLGDLNLSADDVLLQPYLAADDIIDAHAHSHQDKNEGTTQPKIDWILLRGLSASDAGVVHSIASDHPCYWAKINL